MQFVQALLVRREAMQKHTLAAHCKSAQPPYAQNAHATPCTQPGGSRLLRRRCMHGGSPCRNGRRADTLRHSETTVDC